MRRSGVVLAAASLAAVLAFVLHEAERPAPGPLHPSHAALDELALCETCHLEDTEWIDACGTCHGDVSADVTQRRGFHGRMGERGARCERCHVEHHGAAVPLAGATAFAAAGIADREAFDHVRDAGIETGLHERHDELACEACHTSADAPSLARGNKRFRGLSSSCGTCHDDAHDGRFGARCAGCHGQRDPFEEAARFDHSRFPLVDAHADVACESCHPQGPPVESGARPAEPRACAACHESPHGAPPLVLADASDCARCHDTRTFERPFGAAEHAAAGVVLDGRHADAPCAGCHGGPRPASVLERCEDCHDDAHRTPPAVLSAPGVLPSLRTAIASPRWTTDLSCSSCHTPAGFTPATVTADDHDRFGERLSAAHVETPCAACHRASTPLPAQTACMQCHESPHREAFANAEPCTACHTDDARTFADADAEMTGVRHVDMPLTVPHDLACSACHDEDGTFAQRFPGRGADDCARCHGDPHEGAFAGGPFDGAACLDCHTRESFSPPRFTLAQHARTAFPLAGAHGAVACAACHPGEGAKRRFRDTPVPCAGCHDDPHGGVFDRPERPATVDGRHGCARCHTAAGFRSSVTTSFDHGLWTGRVLEGAHARAGCGRCHDRRKDGTLGGAPSACAACHDDPHRGQFQTGENAACDRCHEERDTFEASRFDHDRDTRFALDADHARLECGACHRPVVLPGGETVTLYRPLGSACRDCHAAGGARAPQENR